MMTRHLLVLTIVALAVAPRAGINAQGPQSVRTSGAGREPVRDPLITDSLITSVFLREPGVLVEGAGLKRWTLAMIQDSLNVYAPGVTFIQGSCGSALRDLPLFRQAVVAVNAADSAVTIFVAVIEPQDSALVTVRRLRGDAKRSLAPWPRLVELARTRLTVVQAAIVADIHARAAGIAPTVAASTLADSAELTQVWNTLAAHRSTTDAATARRLLATSPHVYDRLAAVAILSTFDQDDATWHALVGALLDPKDLVREYARAVLRTFRADITRRVDWRPAAPDLHALLQGSDLWSLNETLDMLVATGASPELAGPLLRKGGHAVLVFAGAQNPWARGPAHRFLHAVSGQDLGGNPDRWRAWIATL
jgi:hypothetical protein